MKVTIGKQYTKARRTPSPPNPNLSPIPLYSVSKSLDDDTSYSSSTTTTTTTANPSSQNVSRTETEVQLTKIKAQELIQIEIEDLSFKNQQIVVINIRHYLVLFWILLFANAILVLGYLSIAGKMVTLYSDLFSVSIIKGFLLPSTIISTILSLGHVVVTHFKVEKMHSKKCFLVYRISCVIMLLHYIVMLIAAVVKFPLSITKLREDMFAAYDKSEETETIDNFFVVTQNQRQCCGIFGYEDWVFEVNEAKIEITSEDINYNYPISCCPETEVDKQTGIISCLNGKIWKNGCHNIEWSWINWYMAWYIGILIIGLTLVILLFLQELRLYNYCKIYRTHWVIRNPKKLEETATK